MTVMNQAWDDAIAFLQRELALLIPIALATLLVADVVGTLAAPKSNVAAPSAIGSVVVLIATLWSIVGQLSIMALILKPGSSVAEALRLGLARLGKTILVVLLLAVVFTILMLPVVVGLQISGFDPAVPDSLRNLPVWASFYALVALGIGVWIILRLILVNTLIVDRNPPLITAVKTGFALTRGITAQIFLVLALYVGVMFVLTRAVRFVAGSLFALLGAAIGSPFAGAVMTALVMGGVAAGLALVAVVFMTMLYRRVSIGI